MRRRKAVRNENTKEKLFNVKFQWSLYRYKIRIILHENGVNSGLNSICFELGPMSMLFQHVSELRALFISFIKSFYQT
jgi:hypothetical protein